MIDFDWSLVPGSVLCTVHLLLGLIVGYMACYFAAPDSSLAPPAGQDLRQFQSAVNGVLTQVKQLSSISQSNATALPPAFLEALARLIESISAVQSQAAGHRVLLPSAASVAIVRKDPPQAARRRAEAAAEPLAFEGLSAPLYDKLTQSDGEAEGRVHAERRPYHALQYMAPWSGSLPSPAAYSEVACNDLSSSGVSFFTKELPAEKVIVITLGQEHELLMQAEIVHYQRRQQANAFVYFVGCRFTRRFEHVPDDAKPVRFEMVKSA